MFISNSNNAVHGTDLGHDHFGTLFNKDCLLHGLRLKFLSHDTHGIVHECEIWKYSVHPSLTVQSWNSDVLLFRRQYKQGEQSIEKIPTLITSRNFFF